MNIADFVSTFGQLYYAEINFDLNDCLDSLTLLMNSLSLTQLSEAVFIQNAKGCLLLTDKNSTQYNKKFLMDSTVMKIFRLCYGRIDPTPYNISTSIINIISQCNQALTTHSDMVDKSLLYKTIEYKLRQETTAFKQYMEKVYLAITHLQKPLHPSDHFRVYNELIFGGHSDHEYSILDFFDVATELYQVFDFAYSMSDALKQISHQILPAALYNGYQLIYSFVTFLPFDSLVMTVFEIQRMFGFSLYEMIDYNDLIVQHGEFRFQADFVQLKTFAALDYLFKNLVMCAQNENKKLQKFMFEPVFTNEKAITKTLTQIQFEYLVIYATFEYVVRIDMNREQLFMEALQQIINMINARRKQTQDLMSYVKTYKPAKLNFASDNKPMYMLFSANNIDAVTLPKFFKHLFGVWKLCKYQPLIHTLKPEAVISAFQMIYKDSGVKTWDGMDVIQGNDMKSITTEQGDKEVQIQQQYNIQQNATSQMEIIEDEDVIIL
ncbi:Hypothetical_protein [Hexamita inflata]|uniref:Hypothetical_protein n=1 Tax=Hexamita inflata TaxID=28002 RepID=A0AA86TSX5_9EUKA|nr:Hypothetical protein HINF_LOCUS15404 [Hexamita inflata]